MPAQFRGAQPQFALVRGLVDAFNLPSYECRGYEADDVIACIARRSADAGIDTLVVSGDLDALQLIGDHIKVMMPKRGITDTNVYDAAAWSAPIPLSEASVANGSAPQKFPDFTRGKWQTRKPV